MGTRSHVFATVSGRWVTGDHTSSGHHCRPSSALATPCHWRADPLTRCSRWRHLASRVAAPLASSVSSTSTPSSDRRLAPGFAAVDLLAPRAATRSSGAARGVAASPGRQLSRQWSATRLAPSSVAGTDAS